MLQRRQDGALIKGTIAAAVSKFGVNKTSVYRIWKRAMDQVKEGKVILDVASRKSKCGRKTIDYSTEFHEVKDVPLSRRGTLRSLSPAINVPKTPLFRRLKAGNEIKRISSTIKPLLTEKNRKDRLIFCMSMLEPNLMFEDMYNYVHIDEKWFYMTKAKRSYYVSLNEIISARSCKSKRFILKVMFMAAVARPKYDPASQRYFDGKLEIWPFVYHEFAKNNSKNRPKGSLITKNIESINSREYLKMMKDNVLPAIRDKFLIAYKRKQIIIQQDNAKPHLRDDAPGLVNICLKDRWNITCKAQPPNIPDFNVLDLGFFNAIQSLQHEPAPKTIEDLISSVNNAFADISMTKLDNVFLTLQNCMESTMHVGGSNDYKIVHMNKEKLRREGRLPTSISCSVKALEAAKACLDQSKP